MSAALDLVKMAGSIDREIMSAEGWHRARADAPQWYRQRGLDLLERAYAAREQFCSAHGWAVCDVCERTVPSVTPFRSAIAGEIEICEFCRSRSR